MENLITSKKNKKKRNLQEANKEEDDLFSEQPRNKKKIRKEFKSPKEELYEKENTDHKPIVDESEELPHKKKIKKEFKNPKEELYEKENTDHKPIVDESEELPHKKKSKKGFHQTDNTATEENQIYTQSKKNKKNKIALTSNIEEVDETPSEELRKKKKPREVLNGVDTEDPGSVIKDGISDDSWPKEEYLELLRRIELQLPKPDVISYTARINKLDWNQIKFGKHSVEECKAKWKEYERRVRKFRLLSEVLEDIKKFIETPWLIKKGNRHPEKPVRPLTSYLLFYMEKKNKIMKKYPDLKMKEITKIIGERFNALSEEKKARYVERSKIMQKEYKQNLLKFYEKYPNLTQVPPRKVDPKKPLTPFKHYLKEKLQKHQADENYSQHDLTERYKELWKKLSSKKKAFWIRLAKEEEEKYFEQLHCLHEDVPTYKSVITKEENCILDRVAGKPEKPPNSAYSLFSRLMLKLKDDNAVEGKPKNRMKEVAAKWKELPDEQKNLYAEEVKHMHENYKLEFANYLESLPEEKRAEELAKVQPKKKTVKLKQKSINNKASEMNTSPKEELFQNIEPEKPPVTAWDLYKNEFVKKNSHLSSNIACKKAADSWKTLSGKEIEKYKKKHERLKEKYMTDFEIFIKNLSEDQLNEYYALRGNENREEESNEESVEEESSSENEESDSSGESDSEESDSSDTEESKEV